MIIKQKIYNSILIKKRFNYFELDPIMILFLFLQ